MSAFADIVMEEVSAAILAITSPIDMSDPDKLRQQEIPNYPWFLENETEFPLATVHVLNPNTNLVANDRYETSIDIDVSINFLIQPSEKLYEGVEAARVAMLRLFKKVLERQRTGEALTPLYPAAGVEADATYFKGPDHTETDTVLAQGTARFTLNHLET
jgi:hypothetical protein